jgi:hypothetical protein
MRYRYVGTVADSLAHGQPVAPGEFVDLDDDQEHEPHNKSLLEAGTLIQAPGPGKANRPKDSAGRDVWNLYATSLNLSPSDYDRKEDLIAAVDAELGEEE